MSKLSGVSRWTVTVTVTVGIAGAGLGRLGSAARTGFGPPGECPGPDRGPGAGGRRQPQLRSEQPGAQPPRLS